MELLQVQLADLKKKLSEVENERDMLLARQFSMDKIKDDDSAVLFYTGFPNYGALICVELRNLFPFPMQDLVCKNMPQEFAQYATTRIILDCTELFIQRPSAMLAQSETWSD